jgi:FKBP-type peptidyl-prolyl cis-trans isomerase
MAPPLALARAPTGAAPPAARAPRRAVRAAAADAAPSAATAAAAAAASRRGVLSRAALAAAAAAAALAPARDAAALAMPPGFKKDLRSKRKGIVVPDDQLLDAGDGLRYFDVVVGDGAAVTKGDRIAAHYDCKLGARTIFTTRQGAGVTGGSPAGWDVGTPPGTAGSALAGLDRGVLAGGGMRVGGQRRLVVPPELGYGKRGFGEIPAGATLTFDVALLSIKTSPFGARVKLVEG